MDLDQFIYKPGTHILEDFNPYHSYDDFTKENAKNILKREIKELRKLQDKFYADGHFTLLLIFQALDAAGKDSTINHVMSGINPQGCVVKSFKNPSSAELRHDFLWRCHNVIPDKGMIGIFNRSYYEEVLIVKVHDELINFQHLPSSSEFFKDKDKFWKNRYEDINNFEKMLYHNGTIILKFFLNVSKEEQKNRFMERLHNKNKNWKISLSDYKERRYWDQYQSAYEDCLDNTSTEIAPWYVIPANNKWFMRSVVSEIIVSKMESLNIDYPTLSPEKLSEIDEAGKELEKEG